MPGGDTFNVPSDAYTRYMGRYSKRLAPELIAFAGLRADMRVLDVGCGTGMLTAALAHELGARAVTAVDPSEPFVAACRAQVPEATVLHASAEALPFEDDAFDATVSQLVVNFMSDPEAGVREMARVTRPGGTVASCVWDYGGQMALLRSFWDAAREVAPDRAGAVDESLRMPGSREGELADLWRSCGLRDVHFGSLRVRASYTDFDDLWAPLLQGVGPSGAFLTSLDPERQAALRDALRRRLGADDGPFELPARAWAVAGRAS